MTRETYDDNKLQRLLVSAKTIAVIGASTNPARHSHRVMRYLQTNGYQVVPINPTAAGKTILGEPVLGTLADVPAPIDIVNVFRRLSAIPEVGQEILQVHKKKNIRAAWLQLDLYDVNTAKALRKENLTVVMDRCIKLEHGRLLGATD